MVDGNCDSCVSIARFNSEWWDSSTIINQARLRVGGLPAKDNRWMDNNVNYSFRGMKITMKTFLLAHCGLNNKWANRIIAHIIVTIGQQNVRQPTGKRLINIRINNWKCVIFFLLTIWHYAVLMTRLELASASRGDRVLFVITIVFLARYDQYNSVWDLMGYGDSEEIQI